MPELKKKEVPVIRMDVPQILRQANAYILHDPVVSLCVFAVNMVFMLLFKSIPEGVANPLCLVWVMAYYIFWCGFYRYYYRLKPYLFSKTIFGSMAPSTKALLLMVLVVLAIVLLPLLPLVLGFDDVYLTYYERYMAAVENISGTGEMGASLLDVLIIYGILALLAPPLICNPYMAWISSLRGQNASFRKAGKRTKGNYFAFVIICLLLLYPEAIAGVLDKKFGLNDWLSYTVSTVIFVYTNIIFAKMYDLFYLKH